MGDITLRHRDEVSLLLLQFSPLLGFTPPATLLSKSRKKNSAPFSELSAVDLCSSVVLALALEGLAAFAAKDTAVSSTAGVVPTPALQSPTFANQQLQLPQQLLPPQQLKPLLVLLQPQAVPPPLEVKQLLVVTPQLVEPLLLPLVLHLEMLPQPAVKPQPALPQPLVLLLLLNQLLNA